MLNQFRNAILYFPFRKIVLRGHESRRPVPVCNICYKALTFCGEIIDSPSTLQGQTTAESIQVDENWLAVWVTNAQGNKIKVYTYNFTCIILPSRVPYAFVSIVVKVISNCCEISNVMVNYTCFMLLNVTIIKNMSKQFLSLIN